MPVTYWDSTTPQGSRAQTHTLPTHTHTHTPTHTQLEVYHADHCVPIIRLPRASHQPAPRPSSTTPLQYMYSLPVQYIRHIATYWTYTVKYVVHISTYAVRMPSALSLIIPSFFHFVMACNFYLSFASSLTVWWSQAFLWSAPAMRNIAIPSALFPIVGLKL